MQLNLDATPAAPASPSRSRLYAPAALLALTILFAAGGCPTQTGENIDTGSNSTFSDATPIKFDNSNRLTFSGAISDRNDLDVYDLGTLAPGDEISVDVQTTSGSLDPVAAVFNEAGEVQAINDDRDDAGGNLNPAFDFVLRDAAGTFYLAIAPYQDGSRTATGEYKVTVAIKRGVGVPAAQQQIVFLDWDGGQNITIPNVGTYDLPVFDAAQVGLPSSQTTALKRQVETVVRERYSGFNLLVTSSDAGAPPAADHATVYFGGSDPLAFAISEKIDEYNADKADASIVYTSSFRSAGTFATTPTFNQMANALGNTVSHEVGHLLGLVHTADCSDMMDTTCTNDRILGDQQFSTAKLDSSVFPFGVQNETQLLSWILGLGF